MAILPIVTFPDPILRRTCREVGAIGAVEKQLIENMRETMFAAPGVGLAANQVGVSLRIIVVNMADEKHPQRSIVLINPQIVELGGEIIASEEGCLSVLDYMAEVKRHSRVRVQYLNQEGQPREIEGHNLLARAFQHEIDHLDGILFFDHLGRIRRDLVKRRLIKGAKKRVV